MLITGHYQFQILIKYLSKNSEKTIYRRFSDIEWLHDGLLKYNPGSRIPNLPEKNIWANLSVNNDQILEKRRKHIEEYLNYISNHKFLNLNPNFEIFISENYDKSKGENNGSTFYEKMTTMGSSITTIFKSQTMKGLTFIENNEKLDGDRENLVRLLKAIQELNINMKDYVKINEEKLDAIKNLMISNKNIESYSLDYEDNFSESKEDDDDDSNKKEGGNRSSDKALSKNLNIISDFYEKNKNFYNMIEENICDQIDVSFYFKFFINFFKMIFFLLEISR